MNDLEMLEWWPAMGCLMSELRRIGQPAVADRLADAVRAGSTSGEILDGVGMVLREQRALRSRLDAAGAAAWDAVNTDVKRAYPGWNLGHNLARLFGRTAG